MRLADRDWLLYCRQCHEWTGLHRFLPEHGHFQGEHSLTMNACLNSDLLLGRFLIHHADHEVVPVPDLTDEYTRIRVQEDRFLERYIDGAVEERRPWASTGAGHRSTSWRSIREASPGQTDLTLTLK